MPGRNQRSGLISEAARWEVLVRRSGPHTQPLNEPGHEEGDGEPSPDPGCSELRKTECLLAGRNIEWVFFLAKKPKWTGEITLG